MPLVHLVAGSLIAAAALLLTPFRLFFALRVWCKDFKGLVRRAEPSSPSHGPRPRLAEAEGGAGGSALNMHHVYLSFGELAWCWIFVFFNIQIRTALGMVKWLCRRRLGASTAALLSMERQVGRFLLEVPSLAIHYSHQEEATKNLVFTFRNMGLLDQDGKFKVGRVLLVKVDVSLRAMVSADLDGRTLTATDAFTLLGFYFGTNTHPRIHALANWGLDPEASGSWGLQGRVSVFFTWLGWTFPVTIAPKLSRFFSHACTGLEEVWSHSLLQGVPAHSQVQELQEHSEVVNFVLRLRPIYLETFRKFQESDPSLKLIDAEAHFAMTVLHSLDHYMMERIATDPFACEAAHPDFGAMADLASWGISAGFVSDVPFLMFRSAFRHSYPEGSFPSTIYLRAREISPLFADVINTCIVR